MAQPQGLNLPAIITTAVVTVILTGVIVEGVRALYNYELPLEEARKWETVRQSTPRTLRNEQEMNLSSYKTSVPIEEAIKKVVETGGKMPATQPATRPVAGAVRDLINQSQQLAQQGKYKEAYAVVGTIQELDPRNDYAKGIKPILLDHYILQTQQANREAYLKQLHELSDKAPTSLPAF